MTTTRVHFQAPRVRAEHASFETYLHSVLGQEHLQRPLLVSFTQWDFAVAAIGEVVMTLEGMGSESTLALWSDETPLRDVGWCVDHRIAAVLRSPTIDQRLRSALRAAGISDVVFAEVQRPWKPGAPIPSLRDRWRSALRQLTYRDAPMGRGILEVPPDTGVPVTDDYLWPRKYVQRAALSYAFVYDQASRVMQERRSTSVFVYNGRFLHDSAVAAAARAHGLPVLSYDTGGLETDFDLTVDETHDWSALQMRMRRMYEQWPHPERDDIGESWFIDRKEHTEKDNARFTEEQRKGLGIDRSDDETVVTYFSSSGDEIAELDLDWTSFFGGQEGAVAAVADICRELGYRFVVRTHPHKRFKPARDVHDWHAAVASAGPDLHLDEHSSVDSYTLMRQSDVVVTYGSTTGVEAAFAERPVVVMGPSAYDELGCAVRVQTIDELRAAIKQRTPAKRQTATPYGLMMKRRGFAYQYVQRRSDGTRTLAGVPICEPRMLVRHLSNALHRYQRNQLIREHADVNG